MSQIKAVLLFQNPVLSCDGRGRCFIQNGMSIHNTVNHDPDNYSIPDAIALRAKVGDGRASSTEHDLWRRVRGRYDSKYWRGDLSERSARQLGLIN